MTGLGDAEERQHWPMPQVERVTDQPKPHEAGLRQDLTVQEGFRSRPDYEGRADGRKNRPPARKRGTLGETEGGCQILRDGNAEPPPWVRGALAERQNRQANERQSNPRLQVRDRAPIGRRFPLEHDPLDDLIDARPQEAHGVREQRAEQQLPHPSGREVEVRDRCGRNQHDVQRERNRQQEPDD